MPRICWPILTCGPRPRPCWWRRWPWPARQMRRCGSAIASSPSSHRAAGPPAAGGHPPATGPRRGRRHPVDNRAAAHRHRPRPARRRARARPRRPGRRAGRRDRAGRRRGQPGSRPGRERPCSAAASPEIRCRALELLGRVRRVNDLDGARAAFEQALATADAAGLALWRLRALHELGTIEMFDRLMMPAVPSAAPRQELGAASTGAVIGLQLTAAAMFRRPRRSRTSRRVRARSQHRLRLARPGHRACLRAEICALRRDAAERDATSPRPARPLPATRKSKAAPSPERGQCWRW